MTRILKLQATTRIGRALDNNGKVVHNERKFGEIFNLDVSNDFNNRYYMRLFRHGAVKLIGEASSISIKAERSVSEPTVPLFPSKGTVTDYTEPPEVIDTEVVLPEETETETETEFEWREMDISAIDFLNEDQIDFLNRIGVKTIADIDTRSDEQLKAVHGIGQKRVNQLREIYKLGLIQTDG